MSCRPFGQSWRTGRANFAIPRRVGARAGGFWRDQPSPRRRRPGPARALRRGRGGRRRRPAGVRRPRDRAARPQRRRQVDHDARPGRCRAADRGHACTSPGFDVRTDTARRQARGRLLPRRRRPGAARDAVGAPPALRPAAPARRLGGPGPRPARAVRARRRRAPRDRRLLPRHGPPALGRPGRAARARGAAARRAVRRRRPDRRRGDLRRDQRRPRARRLRPGLHPPARARHRGLLLGPRAARRRPGRHGRPRARWPARRGRVPTAASSTEVRRAGPRRRAPRPRSAPATVRRPRAFAIAAARLRGADR